MNLPNKITMSRIIITIFIIIFLLIPFDSMGINFPKLFINESIVVNLKYFIAGFLFIIAVITDIIDGSVARKKELETSLGKMLDYLADRFLINSCLIIFSSIGFISPIIPVVIVLKDIVLSSVRSVIGSEEILKELKLENVFLYLGITLTFFYNLPFELLNLQISNALLIIAAILSIVNISKYIKFSKKKILA